MKQIVLALSLLVAVPLTACRAQDGSQATASLPPIEIYFSPKGGCTEAVVREINAAKETILVQAYSFTSAPIAKALVNAHKRGVQVQVVLDKSQRTEKYSSATFLVNVGIPTRIDAQHAIVHNKIVVIDGQTVITGSFNFTRNAEENNAENLLVIRDAAIAAKYIANWRTHAAHSDPYGGREGAVGRIDPAPASPIPRAIAQAGVYVASKNSQVFHRPDCKSAAKISEKNLMRFGTREEAIQAGKKPCGECKPRPARPSLGKGRPAKEMAWVSWRTGPMREQRFIFTV